LRELGLCGNQFTSLPDWIVAFPKLIELDISDNQLTTLPLSFGNLSALEVKKNYDFRFERQ